MTRKHIAVLVATVSLCAGCVTGSPLPPEPRHFPVPAYESLEGRIGVVSVLSDNMNLRYDGVLVFQNRKTSADVADWHINDHVADTIVRTLMSRTTKVLGRMDNRELVDPRRGIIDTHALMKRAATHSFDFVVSVRPYFIYEQHYWDAGYGLWGSSQLRSVQSHCAFSWITIEVWDVRRELIIGRSNGRNCDRDETIEVRDHLSHYSTAELATIERNVKRSLDRSVRNALSSSGLL